MKKILLCVAIGIAALVSNAASVSWSAVNLYKTDGVTKYNGAVELLAVTAGGTIADAALVESVTASATGAVASHTLNWADAVVGTFYDFYYRISDADKTLVSTKINAVASAVGSTTVAFGNQKTYTTNADNWSAAPEPTSGLLLLLGMAGLALKRKVA